MPADGALSEAVKTCDLTMEGILSLSWSIACLCDCSSLCSPQEKKMKGKSVHSQMFPSLQGKKINK